MAPKVQTAQTVDFTAFARRVETRLVSYLCYLLGHTGEGEELFQETLLRAHREWKQVKAMENPEAWVFRVARNLAMNQLKRRSVERRALKLRPEPDDVAPQTPAEGEETRAAVQSALETLPLDQREAVCLKVWGECSWVQIGQTLGVSEDTAARLFARGLQAIAPRLKELSP
ncbi:MAG: sigma-70 family RNA polymerase sigma factor [Planctomycetes bacterium]|nr:sigma-70 family RNA polymerase sigma factor [Planctomycetota bacterium]MCA8945697.1 sigma-70 family RNA polymerase sigma factor [Planctomycetota bacterium]